MDALVPELHRVSVGHGREPTRRTDDERRLPRTPGDASASRRFNGRGGGVHSILSHAGAEASGSVHVSVARRRSATRRTQTAMVSVTERVSRCFAPPSLESNARSRSAVTANGCECRDGRDGIQLRDAVVRENSGKAHGGQSDSAPGESGRLHLQAGVGSRCVGHGTNVVAPARMLMIATPIPSSGTRTGRGSDCVRRIALWTVRHCQKAPTAAGLSARYTPFRERDVQVRCVTIRPVCVPPRRLEETERRADPCEKWRSFARLKR